MAKTRPTRRRHSTRPKGRKRISCWLSTETAARLSVAAAHRGLKLGPVVEEALLKYLAGFYVVDPSSPPQLAVVGGDDAAGEKSAS